jgi:hypothetical protein
MSLIRGAKTIGLSMPAPRPSALPPYGPDLQQTIDYLLLKMSNLSVLVEGKADKDRLRTQIAFSDEAIKIQAQDIVLVGDVTIAQIVKEQNGQTSGQVDYRITRVIGDRVQTGTIASNNWGPTDGSAIDLNNGIIIMGGGENPKLLYEDGDLTISGTLTAGSVIATSVTVGGMTMGEIADGAVYGQNIYDSLKISGTVILKGVIQPQDTGAIRAGSISWDTSTGELTGGTGTAVTEFGIIGASSGTATFTLNALTGAAIFSGDVDTGGRVYANGSTSSAEGLAAIVGDGGSGIRGIVGLSTNTSGVVGVSETGAGVFGTTESTTQGALHARNSVGPAVLIESGYIKKDRVNGHTINIYDQTTHALVATYEYSFDG